MTTAIDTSRQTLDTAVANLVERITYTVTYRADYLFYHLEVGDRFSIVKLDGAYFVAIKNGYLEFSQFDVLELSDAGEITLSKHERTNGDQTVVFPRIAAEPNRQDALYNVELTRALASFDRKLFPHAYIGAIPSELSVSMDPSTGATLALTITFQNQTILAVEAVVNSNGQAILKINNQEALND